MSTILIPSVMASEHNTSNPDSYLMRLPVELHKDIIDLLALPEKVHLKLTGRYFASLIKAASHSELLAAENTEWAISRGLFSCMDCVRLRPLDKFADTMRKNKKSRNGSEPHKRFCIDCGLRLQLHPKPYQNQTEQRYTPGTEITVQGKPFIFCRYCNKYTDQVGPKRSLACSVCVPKEKSNPGKSYESYLGYDSDDDFGHSGGLYDYELENDYEYEAYWSVF